MMDLSTLTKLKDVTIRCKSWSIGWVIATLKTIKSEDLQKIAIHLPGNLDCKKLELTIKDIGGTNSGLRWWNLDRLLVQFWESKSIRPKVLYSQMEYGMERANDLARCLMPESSRRGIIDLVEVRTAHRRD